MSFHLSQALSILGRTPQVLRTLLSDLPRDIVRRNEGGDSWSAFDVIGHLIHGEKTDWVPRIKIIMSDRKVRQFEPFDRFAMLRDTTERELADLLQEFESLRRSSLKEVHSIHFSEADFDKTGIHPELGEVTLKQLFSTWVLHDLTHIGQISRVMAMQYREQMGPWLAYFPRLR